MSLSNSYYTNSWFVLMVKPRHEKKVTRLLNKLNFKTYNPTINIVRKWSDRIKKVKVSAIPGIIFIYTNLKEKNKIFYSSSILGWFYENNKPVTVNQNELNLLDKSLNKKNWISSDKEINLNDLFFLKHLGVNVIVNKLGMNKIWAFIQNTNFTLKLDKIRV